MRQGQLLKLWVAVAVARLVIGTVAVLEVRE